MLTPLEIVKSLREVVTIADEDGIVIHDLKRFRDKHVDRLAYQAAFQTDPSTQQFLAWMIRTMAGAAGIIPASIFQFYKEKGAGNHHKVTVPAINIRGMTYDVARAIFQAASSTETAALIFELSRNEIFFSRQSLQEYVTVILAAALREGYIGPIFFQGDHFKFRKEAFYKNPEGEIAAIEGLIKEAITAGFYQIDIDASQLVDNLKETAEEQLRLNAEQTARMIRYIRSLQPKGVQITIGGEIGELGGKNSTVDELRTYLNKVVDCLSEFSQPGLSKITLQTSAVPGGILTSDGRPTELPFDFYRLKELSNLAISAYKLAGVVHHEAAPLPMALMERFPQNNVAEIHLTSGVQNLIFDHIHFPKELKNEIAILVNKSERARRTPGETEAQFLYRNRKIAWGELKVKFWEMDSNIRSEIRSDLQKYFEELFKKLEVAKTRSKIADSIDAVKVLSPLSAEWKGWVTK